MHTLVGRTQLLNAPLYFCSRDGLPTLLKLNIIWIDTCARALCDELADDLEILVETGISMAVATEEVGALLREKR